MIKSIKIMREAINKISIVYYSIYTATIIFTVIGFFMNLNNISIETPKIEIVTALTYGIITYVSAALVLAFGLFEINKIKWRKIEDDRTKYEQYKKGAILRLMLIGTSLLGGILIYYFLLSVTILYCIAASAIALIYSKPSEAKLISDLKLDME